MRLRPTLSMILFALLGVSCSERPTLIVRIDHPSTFDPAVAAGQLVVELFDANTAMVEKKIAVPTQSLTERQRLFEGLELVEGRAYQIRLQASFDASSSSCLKSDHRAVGVSPPFRHDRATDAISIYMDCAGAVSPTGSMNRQRLYHSATFLPTPHPHGQVVLINGSKPEAGMTLESDKIQPINSVEVFDPRSGRFTELDGKLSFSSALHQATAIAEQTVLITGGIGKPEGGGQGGAVSLERVEQISADRISRLGDLPAVRLLHRAVRVGGDRTLLVGGIGKSLYEIHRSLVLLDPSGKVVESALPTLKVSRTSPEAVAFDGGRKILVVGSGIDTQGAGLPAEVLCLDGNCGCGAPPCVSEVKGFPKGAERYSMTATLVSCPSGEEAIYVVGGQQAINGATYSNVSKDIFCLDGDEAGAGLSLVGSLNQVRSGHTATTVHDAGGRKLFVAGGIGPKKPSSDEHVLWSTGELVPVSCDCQVTGAVQEVDLETIRLGHTATVLADGTVLLAGGFTTGPPQRFNPAR